MVQTYLALHSGRGLDVNILESHYILPTFYLLSRSTDLSYTRRLQYERVLLNSFDFGCCSKQFLLLRTSEGIGCEDYGLISEDTMSLTTESPGYKASHRAYTMASHSFKASHRANTGSRSALDKTQHEDTVAEFFVPNYLTKLGK